MNSLGRRVCTKYIGYAVSKKIIGARSKKLSRRSAVSRIIAGILAIIIIQAAIVMHGSLIVLGSETLSTDLNNDGTVNILDISIVAKAFGWKTGDPKWNPIADLVLDGVINILDVSRIAKDWGKNAPLTYGGTLIITYNTEPTPSLDPIFYMTGYAGDTVHYALFETLVIYDFNMTIRPYLAESFTQDNSTSYTFKIRQGVKFHDNTTCDAQAVKFNFERMINVSSPRQAAVTMIGKMEVLDNYTIRFILKKPYGDFLHNLATSTGIASPTAIQKWGNDFGLHPVGTGPFQFVEWVKGDHITMKVFKDHWGGRPYLDEVIIRIVPEASVRTMQLETGEASISDLPVDQAVAASGLAHVQVQIGPPAMAYFVTINQSPNGTAALKDVQVRQAINYAINRKDIVDTLLYGYARVGIGPLYPSIPQYNAELQEYPDEGNITKAKELLQQAGYGGGLKLNLLTYPGIHTDIAVILASQLAEAGIEINIDSVEFSVYAQRLLVTKEFDIATHGWSGTGPTAFGVMGQYFNSNETGAWHWNMGGVKDAVLDQLIGQLEGASDPAEKQNICDQMQRTIINNAYCATTLYPDRVHAANKAVQGYRIHPHTWYGSIIYCSPLNVNVWLKPS